MLQRQFLTSENKSCSGKNLVNSMNDQLYSWQTHSQGYRESKPLGLDSIKKHLEMYVCLSFADSRAIIFDKSKYLHLKHRFLKNFFPIISNMNIIQKYGELKSIIKMYSLVEIKE